MRKTWTDQGWDDYIYWQSHDKKTLRLINDLVRNIEHNGLLTGIGKPEPLKNDLQGLFSRRIDETSRLVYCLSPDGALSIISCRDHYEK